MSGHSKWATTKHKKAAIDAKRSSLFSKLSRNITVAAKMGGDPNPDNNATLAAAVARARMVSMPNAKIKAAIEEQAREDEQPQSSNFTLRKILGGDILSTRLLRNNIWLIITAVIFTIVYISNRYSVQKYLIEIDKLQKELEDAKYRALSSSSQLTEKTRESHILEILKTRKDSVLKMSDRPPYIIDVPEK